MVVAASSEVAAVVVSVFDCTVAGPRRKNWSSSGYDWTRGGAQEGEREMVSRMGCLEEAGRARFYRLDVEAEVMASGSWWRWRSGDAKRQGRTGSCAARHGGRQGGLSLANGGTERTETCARTVLCSQWRPCR